MHVADKQRAIDEGRTLLAAMVEALARWSESDLDAFLCPHPAMGPLTVRVMVMFTALHADHHRKGIEKLVEAA